MAKTPSKANPSLFDPFKSPSICPSDTPIKSNLRRSPRLKTPFPEFPASPPQLQAKALPISVEDGEKRAEVPDFDPVSPITPALPEQKKRKRSSKGEESPPKKKPTYSPRGKAAKDFEKKQARRKLDVDLDGRHGRGICKERSAKVELVDGTPSKEKATHRRVYYRRVVYDGGDFTVGDDVYVKRREDADSDAEDPEVEECRICFQAGKGVMIECDDCLGGFHIKCIRPRMKKVPEGEWICRVCDARKKGEAVELPRPPDGRKRSRSAREKLLSSDLWAARIEGIWRDPDGTYWFKGRWYLIPEETAIGRQPHNLRRELFRTNDFDDIQMESVLRHCYVLDPIEFSKANNEGDDVFLCEYEYDVQWQAFKRISETDTAEEKDQNSEDEWDSSDDLASDDECEKDKRKGYALPSTAGHMDSKSRVSHMAANTRKGRIFGLQRIGAKRIPDHVRSHKQTEIEKAKATLLLASLPTSPPCRLKEMEEITAFVKGAIGGGKCLGRCLYIHGVPGTGKTMSVLAVMRNLKSEVDRGTIPSYRFVEINGLKLATPENIYRVIYEALSGHRVGWKKALQLLNDRFSEGHKRQNEETQPCILLIDELDLLVTRNQSILYNILDWPTKADSKLIVIGIANTMDLPEKLLPRISSRMGMQRLCFGPYTHQQLQEIISCRLNGINAFEKQAIEFAARKVAAISGDARRALELCRRAAELADYNTKQIGSKASSCSDKSSAGKVLIGMSEVEAAIHEMFQAPHIQMIKRCSKLSKIMLVAMVLELYKSGVAEITFGKLASIVSTLCVSNGEPFPGWDTLLRISCKLGECRIILCEVGYRHSLQKLQLNFPSDDVAFALKDCSELPWVHKYF
ncbi:origin of replication complex subunit 1B-like [Nymphaea colorata]|nr:origin of replication complex subunit 1B-like [Nymphaea colorata]